MYKSIGSHFQDKRTLLSLVKLKIDRIKNNFKVLLKVPQVFIRRVLKTLLDILSLFIWPRRWASPLHRRHNTTRHTTRHRFQWIQAKNTDLAQGCWLATNSLKPNYQDLNGNLLLKTFKMYINRHFKLHIAHKEMSLGCFLLFPALRTSVSESFDFLKKTRENSCFLHCQKNIQNSTLPLLQFLQIFACPEAEDYSF